MSSFAIVGAVNHGKSSVVSTLAENDQVFISSMPGETVENQRFSLRDLFVFHDTPGFQNAFEALEELRPAARARDPLQCFAEFIRRHRDALAFQSECRLFEPIVEGAGIIYVVDGSRPVLDINLAEMELLRLTGRPRLAVINRTTVDDHVADWKQRLGLHFNAVREFNAHRAAFADRIELLETLAHIEQSWKPSLMEAVRILRAEWEARLEECAAIVVELLVAGLRHRESREIEPARSVEALIHELKQRYMRSVAGMEVRAHTRIIELFSHHLVKAPEEPVFTGDLFSDETWRLFGLTSHQLVAAGAVSGLVAGAGADVITGGHSLGLFAAGGAVAGVAGAFLLGKARPELTVTLPGGNPLAKYLPGRLQISGRVLVVGPYKALNFPWILLDRALGVFAYVTSRAHARREKTVLKATELAGLLQKHRLAAAQWDESRRRQLEKLFAAIRAERFKPEDREAMCRFLVERLREISLVRIEPADSL